MQLFHQILLQLKPLGKGVTDVADSGPPLQEGGVAIGYRSERNVAVGHPAVMPRGQTIAQGCLCGHGWPASCKSCGHRSLLWEKLSVLEQEPGIACSRGKLVEGSLC